MYSVLAFPDFHGKFSLHGLNLFNRGDEICIFRSHNLIRKRRRYLSVLIKH